MADDDHDLTVEATASGASQTYPREAGQLKKGDFVCIKGRPCKVVELTTSKTGKHGHAKAHIIGIDIFTNKKCEENSPTTHTMDCPNVVRRELQVTDVHDGRVVCIDDEGHEEEFELPEGELGEQITKKFKDESDFLATIVAAMGEEHIVAVKDDAKAGQ